MNDSDLTNKLVSLSSKLISIRSLSGDEGDALLYLLELFTSFGWDYEKIPVSENRFNIFVPFGTPRICFTTHIDVVPAPEDLWKPVISDGKLIGRGACDAKGILASMIIAVNKLVLDGNTDLSLLVVVGEETDGIGAKTAAKYLYNRGIKYLINGEPTDGSLVTAHKGGLSFTVSTKGKACHSGYPEYGEDANKKLIEVAYKLQNTDFGYDELLGPATINLGLINAGSASNILSDNGIIHGMIRTVTDSDSVVEILESVVGENGVLEINNIAPKVELKTLDGFRLSSVSYVTDIPHFMALGTENLLYGPGSIREAHTNSEWVRISDLADAVTGYCKIYSGLCEKL
ncbi:MAG TPA: M20/M25/M40 family metallo-hydrolase [Oligoflexia bacterium]|nr:M20/M25/M40 family metallo-hydrolase [Oligoflexia bacterium]HMP49069.1 M20/M25/M40 family metallo-hydrolase [Oligoflexia bacterium]